MSDSNLRTDAAAVYRCLRDAGAADAGVLADRCFPTMHGSSDPAYKSLRKRGVRRVLDAVAYIRAAGTTVWCVPGVGFSLEREQSRDVRSAPAHARSDVITVSDPWHEGSAF